jgi:putative PIN family toxin of toxin-antitoxin system
MIVVVDTNVFIKSLLYNDQWCNQVLSLEATGQIQLAMNKEMYNELVVQIYLLTREMGLDDKFFFSISKKLSNVLWRICMAEHNICTLLCKEDPDDNKFLDCAIESKADYIITEDHHFNPDFEKQVKDKYRHTVKILSPYNFINEFHMFKLRHAVNSKRITR